MRELTGDLRERLTGELIARAKELFKTDPTAETQELKEILEVLKGRHYEVRPYTLGFPLIVKTQA